MGEFDFFDMPSVSGLTMLEALVENARSEPLPAVGAPEPKFLCKLEDISPLDLFYGPRNIRVRNGNIFYLPVGLQHQTAEEAIQEGIAICFHSTVQGILALDIATQYVPFFNIYACGATQTKISDAGSVKIVRNRRVVLAVEVSFSNESIIELMYEVGHYLTKYTSVSYVLASKLVVDKNNDNAFWFFYVCKRRVSCSEEEIERLAKWVEHGNKPGFGECQRVVVSKEERKKKGTPRSRDVPFTVGILANMFNFDVVYSRIIGHLVAPITTEETERLLYEHSLNVTARIPTAWNWPQIFPFHEPFSFTLQGSPFELNGNLTVPISKDRLQFVLHQLDKVRQNPLFIHQ